MWSFWWQICSLKIYLPNAVTTGWGAPRRMRSLSASLCAVDGMTVMHNLVHGENTLRSRSASAVRSHPFSIYCRGDFHRHCFFLRSCLWILFCCFFLCIPSCANESLNNCLVFFFFFLETPVPCSSFSLLSWPCSGNQQAEKLQIDYKPSHCRD